MSKTCSECTYLDECNEDDKMYWCDQKFERVSPNAAACEGFCEAYRRSYETAKSLRENAKDSSSSGSGCFITTVVCEILGYADGSKELQSLRTFRDSVLQKDAKYKKILAIYDVIGPAIVSKIRSEKCKKQICKNLFELSIKKVCELVEESKYSEAIDLYMDMTYLLMRAYGIQDDIDNNYIDNMDVEKSGHGRQIMLAK